MFVRLLLLATAVSLAGGWLRAAEPRARDPRQPFPDFAEFFDRFFGPQTDEEKQALAAIKVSVKEEQQMGRTAVQTFLADLKRQNIRVLQRGKDVDYLRDLVETIHARLDGRRRYPVIQIYLAQSPRCDARSFPGGTVVFFRGLLESAESEAAVIGIVGHELSHLDRGHHLSRVRRVKLAEQTFSGGGDTISPERFFGAGASIMRLWTQPFQSEDELEADSDGARWAYQAGYDPREMARLLLDLRKHKQGQQIPMPSFLQSHPSPASRHQALMDLHEELQQDAPAAKLYVGTENLRRRVARSRQEFDK